MIINPLIARLENYQVSVLKSYEQVYFWLTIIRDKKPFFYLTQDYSKVDRK